MKFFYHENLEPYDTLMWPDPFLTQSVYSLQYKRLAMPFAVACSQQAIHDCMQHMLCTASYYFHLELWSIQLLFVAMHLYRLEFGCYIHSQHSKHLQYYTYNFSISSCNRSEGVLLLNRVLKWIQQVDFRVILHLCLVLSIL